MIFILALIDILQTRKGLRLGYVERNPVALKMFQKWSFKTMVIIKLIVAAGTDVLIWASGSWIVFAIFLAIYLAPVVNNFIMLRIKRRNEHS